MKNVEIPSGEILLLEPRRNPNEGTFGKVLLNESFKTSRGVLEGIIPKKIFETNFIRIPQGELSEKPLWGAS